jgi:hypothetical protein
MSRQVREKPRVSASGYRHNAAMNAETRSRPKVSRAWIAYLVQLVVFSVLAMSAPAAYAVSGDILVLDLGTFAGLPWSIPLWFVGGPPSPRYQALVVGCALLNVVLLAALLGFAWVKTNRGAHTDSCNGTWKVCALASGSLLLVAVGGFGVLYAGSLSPAFLFGSAAAVMLPGAMFYLLPWRRVAGSLVVAGACVAGLWMMFGMALAGLGSNAF